MALIKSVVSVVISLISDMFPTGRVWHWTDLSHNMTKPTEWVCTQRRLRSAWASTQSEQSLRCPLEETLGPKLPIERTAKTDQTGLISVFTGCSVTLLVLSCRGSCLELGKTSRGWGLLCSCQGLTRYCSISGICPHSPSGERQSNNGRNLHAVATPPPQLTHSQKKKQKKTHKWHYFSNAKGQLICQRTNNLSFGRCDNLSNGNSRLPE